MTSFSLALPQLDSDDDLCNRSDSDDETVYVYSISLL